MPVIQGPPPGTLGPPGFRYPPGTLPHPSLLRPGPPPPPGAPSILMPPPQTLEPPAPGGPPLGTLNRANETPNTIGTHVPLAKCRVLYIGSVVPTETSVGIEAVQQPLNDRYCTDGRAATNVPGIDAWLTVFSSGVLLQYTGDRSTPTWFPIHTLHVSAAVKCVPQISAFNGQPNCRFMSLDSPPSKSSNHPPVFAAIMRRTSGVKVLECHSFICKSDQAALALVQSTTHAYEHKEGWVDETPPKELYQELEATINTADPNAEPDLPIFQPSDKEAIDKPPAKGHFYNAKPELVKSFNVHHPQKNPTNLMSHVVPPPAQRQPPRPLPMVPTMERTAYSNPYLLPTPAPPNGYFEDWDVFQGQPVMVFPGPYMSEAEYKKTIREVRSRRKPRTNDRRRDRTYDRPPKAQERPTNRDRTYDRHYERERTYDRHLPRREPSPQRYMERPPPIEVYDPPPLRRDYPPSDYMDDMGNHYYKGPPEPDYGYRDELPRAIERREYIEPDPNMVLYAPRYMRHIDPDPRDYETRPRYPRNEREFGASMTEERRLIGDNYRPDPYKLNDYRSKDDTYMFRDGGGYGGLTRDLGYFP